MPSHAGAWTRPAAVFRAHLPRWARPDVRPVERGGRRDDRRGPATHEHHRPWYIRSVASKFLDAAARAAFPRAVEAIEQVSA
ncbi:MAG TPA: hypothetical protein VF516_33750, partial [Kofleriaceae bacterium]